MTDREQKRINIERQLIGMAVTTGQPGELFGQMEPEDFQISEYRRIFEQYRAQWQKTGNLGADDIYGLPEAIQRTAMEAAALVTSNNAPQYCILLKTLNACEAAQGVAGRLMYCESVEDMTVCAEELIRAIQGANTRRDTAELKDLLAGFISTQNKPREYIKTGHAKLDKYTYIERGDFVVVGARPSEGKTAFALNLTGNLARAGLKVGFFSLETSPPKLTDRFIAAVCSLDYGRIKRGELDGADWKKFFAVQREVLNELPIWFVPASGKTVAWMRAEASRLQLDVAIIDYLSLVRSKGRDIYEQTTNTSLELHEWAQQSKTVVIALSQLNRGDAGKEPTLERLRESGQIEQDADIVILMHNPPADEAIRPCKLIIAKNKEGICGVIQMWFEGRYQQFSEVYDGSR